MHQPVSIPGYHLTHRLGCGPLTCVWAARDAATDDAVAVKFARPDCDDPPLAALLLEREARVGLTVRHPHLVRVRTASRQPPVVVTDLLAGESLRDRLRRDYRLDAGQALWVARQTAEALSALHRAGFVHGDVKPENIRLTAPGAAVLIDLGFAHRPGENADLLNRGLILGTANYLAPEVCSLVPDADGRADVFSLGVMLFEMLTGELPYPSGTTAQTLRAHRDDRPTRLPGQTPMLAAMVSRLLVKRPAQRPHASQAVQNLIGLEIALMRRPA